MVKDYEIFTAQQIEKYLVQIRSALGPEITRLAFVHIAELATNLVRLVDAKNEGTSE